MIHFATIKSTSLILATLFLASCSASATHNQKELVSSIDLALVQESEPAKTFVNLCMANNKSVPAIEVLALETKWLLAEDKELEEAKLSKLRRTILEIPGGGGRFRETQTLLIDKSHETKRFLNLMQKFDRRDKLVSTKCVLYVESENHLPICTSIGKLLKRPPDSNSKFSKAIRNSFVGILCFTQRRAVCVVMVWVRLRRRPRARKTRAIPTKKPMGLMEL